MTIKDSALSYLSIESILFVHILCHQPKKGRRVLKSGKLFTLMTYLDKEGAQGMDYAPPEISKSVGGRG